MYSLLRTFLDEQQAMLILLMLVSIPLSYSLSIIKQKYLIMGISIVASAVFQSIMFPTEKYFLWGQQQIVYLILYFGPRNAIGKIVFIESFIFLAVIQIRRMYISYAVNGVDITGILMMQTFLYIGLAYNYQNGLKDAEKLTDSANRRKVIALPNYFTYIGYVFFLPACLIGPVFQFRDYQDFIQRKGDYANLPSTIKPALMQLRTFIIVLSIYVATMPFNLWDTVKPQFAQHSYLYKLFYIGAVIFHIEFKYIAAWSMGMISIHASGISYSKETNSFDKIQVTKILQFFLNPSLKIKAQCWNMSVQVALKRYIYEQNYNSKETYQSQKKRKKVQASAQRNTMLASAFWHGFYPGYFLSFMHWMIYLRMIQELFRLRKINQKVDNLWTKYHFGIVENIVSNYVFMYFGVFLHVMTWQNIKAILYATYGIPFFILYGLYIAIYQLQMLSKPKRINKIDSGDSVGQQSSVQSPRKNQVLNKDQGKTQVKSQ